jgi:hypothetical protein
MLALAALSCVAQTAAAASRLIRPLRFVQGRRPRSRGLFLGLGEGMARANSYLQSTKAKQIYCGPLALTNAQLFAALAGFVAKHPTSGTFPSARKARPGRAGLKIHDGILMNRRKSRQPRRIVARRLSPAFSLSLPPASLGPSPAGETLCQLANTFEPSRAGQITEAYSSQIATILCFPPPVSLAH